MMKSNVQCISADSTSVLLDCRLSDSQDRSMLLSSVTRTVTGNIAGAWTVRTAYYVPTKRCDSKQAPGATQPSSIEHQNTSPSSSGITMQGTIPPPPFIFKAWCRLEHRVNLSCGLN